MGWKEGLGLGKDNQGRTDIIRTDDGRTNSAGQQGGRGHWALNYTNPQSFTLTFSYLLT